MNHKKNQLVAFYLGNVAVDEIRRQLAEKIPSYMIPHKVVQINKMPLNKNGKMDREYFRNRMEVAM